MKPESFVMLAGVGHRFGLWICELPANSAKIPPEL